LVHIDQSGSHKKARQVSGLLGCLISEYRSELAVLNLDRSRAVVGHLTFDAEGNLHAVGIFGLSAHDQCLGRVEVGYIACAKVFPIPVLDTLNTNNSAVMASIDNLILHGLEREPFTEWLF